MFIELCGNFNKDNLLSTKFYREFFDKRGNLRDFSLKDKRDFTEKMTERIKKDGLKEDVDMIVDLLSNMIKLSSYKRYNINDVLKHKWLKS